MIFSFLKNWKFILDVIIVLVLIVALFIWNPFGIFGGKAKLLDTANMVTEIRSIGQLVTAEYYGEVISSLEEARMEFIEDENVQERAKAVFSDLVAAMDNLRKFEEKSTAEREQFVLNYTDMDRRQRRRIVRQDVDRNNIREKMDYLGYLEDLETEPMFLEVLEYWYRSTTEKLDKRNFDFDPKTQDQALMAIYEANLAKGSALQGNFMAFYYDTKKKEFTKKELRRKIAMVGRGWVKAGFDFTDLDPSALVYYPDQQEIHIMGLAPTVLNADINPWFIPEKGVPGFEILDVNGRIDFEDAKKVKEYCVRKLKDFANRANILQNAEKQGEETLKNLFTLLIGQEIKKVVFHHDPFVQQVHEIEKDSIVSLGELSLFDSIYQQKIRHLDSLRNLPIQDSRTKNSITLLASQLKFGINRLKKLTVYDLGEPFNYFSYQILNIAGDGTIDPSELTLLQDVWRREAPLTVNHDQSGNWKEKEWEMHLWFEDFASYSQQFNSAIRSLSKRNLASGDIHQSKYSLSQVSNDPRIFDTLTVINIHQFSVDSVLVNYVLDSGSNAGELLTTVFYPFQFDRKLLDSAVASKDLRRVQKSEFKKDSLDYFYIVPDTGAYAYGFPARFERLIYPTLAASYKQSGGLKIQPQQSRSNAGYTIIFDDGKKDSLETVTISVQSSELYRYLTQIGEQNQQYQNRNLFRKFTGYINGKLEERTNPPDWYSRLKKKL